MKVMWLFRSNIRELEYYHQFTSLEEFKEKCHDFYILQGICYLENDYLDEFIVWRLSPNFPYIGNSFVLPNGKKFSQK